MAHLYIIFFLVFATSSSAIAQKSLDSNLGLVMPMDGGKTCILSPTSQLKAGQRISVVLFDEFDKRQSILLAIVGKKDPSGCEEMDDRATHPYELIVKSEIPVLGIGVLTKTQFHTRNRHVRADLNGDRRPESFRICWSSEGGHLTVWSGTPLKSKRLWHSYYYAGYDTQFNCKKKDYR